MRRRAYIYLFVAMLMVVTSCDKWDCNGDLDGMWQLTEWRDASGNVKATKDDMIYYSFQLQMACFRRQTGKKLYIRSSMKASPEEILIYEPIEYVGDGHDAIQPMSVLAPFGVPDDGILRVQVLTGSQLMLTTSDQNVLTFRKF